MMTEERFLTLVGAYGADPQRWPLGERAAATAFLDANPELVAACLEAEAALDAVLAAHLTRDPSAAFRGRLVGAAPRQRAVGRTWRWLAGAGLGLGLAASCAAGVAAGFTLAPASVSRLFEPATGQSSSLADPVGDVSAS
ncbi:MAG TPA: hypothetical protein VMT68_18035 [Caulobacteraceae bacterium]|nr:hypothetical protein [Caulobacteraceae bacterium]